VECLLVAILRPFWRFTKADFGPFDPKDRCYAHCASLMDTIWTYRAFASLNAEYWYNHTLATVAFISFREHENSSVQTEILIKACKCLHEMTELFPLAVDSLSAIRGAFKLAGMAVPTYLQPFLENGINHRKDGLLHHSAAKLLPGGDLSSTNAAQQEMRYQELLDELDSIGLD
jgi:hypothetical protein